MNSYRKQRCIDIARSMVDERTGRYIHFSFLLNKNQLLLFATNDYTRRHPEHLFGEYKPTRSIGCSNYIVNIHSEIGLLKQFLNKNGNLDVSGLTLFNVRLDSKGNVKNAKPCKNCERVLNGLNFKKIEWTIDER